MYLKQFTSGRNKAVAIGGADVDGAAVRCVVKLRDQLGAMAPVVYLFEWVAAALGRRLGLAIPEPYGVQITAAFAAAQQPPIQARFAASLGLAFGSCYRHPLTQLVKGMLLPIDLREAAAEVLAFDVFIHNVDRRFENPNLMYEGGELVPYDHDAAFAFLFGLGAADPATDALEPVIKQHVFHGLFGRKMPSLDGFRSKIESLTDADFDALTNNAPPEWQIGAAAGKLTAIVDVMRRRRDAIDTWLPKVESCMQA